MKYALANVKPAGGAGFAYGEGVKFLEQPYNSPTPAP
jgi:hypothetical protein